METLPAQPSAQRGTNFYRSPVRVAVLTFFADPFYTVWWLWQLFKFTKREGFPRARSFWWLLVPIYGLYVLYQQLDDLKKAIAATSGQPAVNPGLVVALVFIADYLGRIFARSTAVSVELTTFIASSAVIAVATYLTQRAATGFLQAKYREEQRQGFTWGEIVATLLGILFFALNLYGTLAS